MDETKDTTTATNGVEETVTTTETLKIVMNLSGEGAKTHTLSLADPVDDIDYAKVNAVVGKIIEDDLLDVGGRTVKTLKEAYVHKVTDTQLEAS